MSRPSSYLPDPKGWIETAPSSSRPRKPSQRPLTSFSHGLATPPTSSGFKRSALSAGLGTAGPGPSSTASKVGAGRWRNLEIDTPVPAKQSSLKGFFTPPTTGAEAKGLKKKRGGKGEEPTPLSQRAGSQSRGLLGFRRSQEDRNREKEGSRLKVYKDTEDFWGSESDEDQDEDEEVIPAPSQTTKSKARTPKKGVSDAPERIRPLHRSSSSPEIASLHHQEVKGDNEDGPARHLRSADRARPRTPARERSRLPEGSPPLFEPPAHTPSPAKVDQPSSSSRPVTPVPDYILDIHRQLCGQDSERRKQVKSPWTKRDPPEAGTTSPRTSVSPTTKKRKRNIPTAVEEVDRRVWEKAHQDRHKTPESKTKHLVELSSSSNPPSDEVDRRVWDIVHGKSAEKGKKLVTLSSSDPLVDEVSSPTKMGKGKGGAVAVPLSPLSTNRLPKRNPSLSQQMLVQASPIGRPRTPRKKASAKSERVISPLLRTSARQTLPLAATVNAISLLPKLPRPPSPSPLPASLDDKIIAVVEQARENEAKLEKDLLAMCDPSTSQAYSSSQRKARSQKHQLLPEAEDASTPPTQHPTSPEQLLVTPRKRSPFLHAHHKLTPPKSGSKSVVVSPLPPSQSPMVNRQQTLFVLPDPPKQPDFSPEVSSKARRAEWRPVEMQPETLVTWSMGGESLQPLPEDDLAVRQSATSGEAQAGDDYDQESQDAPLFGDDERDSIPGTPLRRPALADRLSSSKSIEPTIFSQNFPVLVPTSPVGSSSPTRPARTWSREIERQELARLSSPPPAPVVVPTTAIRGDRGTSQAKPRSTWDHLSRGVLAGTPVRPIPPPTAADTSSSKKRKSTASQRSQASQSKLAAFGFFGEAAKKGKGRQHDFEKDWDEEEDHEFLEDPAAEGSGAGPDSEATSSVASGSGKQMGNVPEAPYHPHLRAAGIRELEKRAATTTSTTNDPRLEPRSGHAYSPLSRSREEPKPFLEDEEEDLPLFERSDGATSTTGSGSGSGMGSSQLTDTTTGTGEGEAEGEGGVKTPKEVRDWWDALGERRTSEFGALD